MGFLIRSAFWLSLVLLVIPFEGEAGDPAGKVGPLEALNAAREAAADLGGICERKPDVCETGRAAFHTIGVRAREGAKIAYEMMDDRFGAEGDSAEAAEPDITEIIAAGSADLVTGSTKPASAAR